MNKEKECLLAWRQFYQDNSTIIKEDGSKVSQYGRVDNSFANGVPYNIPHKALNEVNNTLLIKYGVTNTK